jgi:hypothetical protein
MAQKATPVLVGFLYCKYSTKMDSGLFTFDHLVLQQRPIV